MEYLCCVCQFELVPAQILRLNAAWGARIICEAGVIWVTQEGHTKDYFLIAGESLCIDAKGMVLVEAMGGAAAKLKLSRAHQRCASGILSTVHSATGYARHDLVKRFSAR